MPLQMRKTKGCAALLRIGKLESNPRCASVEHCSLISLLFRTDVGGTFLQVQGSSTGQVQLTSVLFTIVRIRATAACRTKEAPSSPLPWPKEVEEGTWKANGGHGSSWRTSKCRNLRIRESKEPCRTPKKTIRGSTSHTHIRSVHCSKMTRRGEEARASVSVGNRNRRICIPRSAAQRKRHMGKAGHVHQVPYLMETGIGKTHHPTVLVKQGIRVHLHPLQQDDWKKSSQMARKTIHGSNRLERVLRNHCEQGRGIVTSPFKHHL